MPYASVAVVTGPGIPAAVRVRQSTLAPRVRGDGTGVSGDGMLTCARGKGLRERGVGCAGAGAGSVAPARGGGTGGAEANRPRLLRPAHARHAAHARLGAHRVRRAPHVHHRHHAPRRLPPPRQVCRERISPEREPTACVERECTRGAGQSRAPRENTATIKRCALW
eukprot:1286209-Pyramimonas_sp.AAC.1